jgi:hypothetical protein
MIITYTTTTTTTTTTTNNNNNNNNHRKIQRIQTIPISTSPGALPESLNISNTRQQQSHFYHCFVWTWNYAVQSDGRMTTKHLHLKEGNNSVTVGSTNIAEN